MRDLEFLGLTLECTGVGTDRELHTIRLNTDYVASICFSAKADRFGVRKAGYWNDICLRSELTKSQLAAINSHFKRQTKRFNSNILGGQK